MTKRLQVDIKPGHQPIVKTLMKKLGGVSSADAVGFLIETQGQIALARLEPTAGFSNAPEPKPQRFTQTPVSSNPQCLKTNSNPKSEAEDALSMVLGS